MKRHYLFGIWNEWLKAFVLLNDGVRFGRKSKRAMEQSLTWHKVVFNSNYTIKRFEANQNETFQVK